MGLFKRRKSKDLPPTPDGPPPVPIKDSRSAPTSLPPTQQRPRASPPPQYHAPQSSGITGQDGSRTTFQPAGYLPPPPGWTAGPPPPAYPQQPASQQAAPIVVNQHYYLLQGPPSSSSTSSSLQTPAQAGPAGNGCAMTKLLVGSAVNLTNQVMPGVLPSFLDEGAGQGIRMLGPGCAAADRMCDRFNNLMTLIDRDRYAGNEKDLFTYQPGSSPASSSTGAGKPKRDQQGRREHDHPKGQTTAVAAKVVSGSYFAKVELYANARLPMDLPPLKLYIPTWPLVCLAARYSERVYEKPRGKEKDVHVESDSRTGTKAMCIKSVPMDDMNTIVFAIRGTATFGDWTVNLKTEPVSPEGFLDDCGNYCHAGFLSVARRMVAPVAARLRQLLQENPTRRSSSLLITGHSAGGAVAALLYAHMHSTSLAARSELSVLTSGFKRVHCVTFGTPPVSLLPLQRPTAPEFRKSLFLSFVNEGDPVARADKAYVRSLLELFATPVPALAARTVAAVAAENRSRSAPALLLPNGPEPDPKKAKSRNSVVSTKSGRSGKQGNKIAKNNDHHNNKASSSSSSSISSSSSNGKGSHVQAHKGPVWKVPPCTLSSAGRIVVLRSGDPKARLKGKKTVEERLNEGVVAQMTTDEQLRTQIWGDPVCHLMKLYAGRLEILAVNAVTANGY